MMSNNGSTIVPNNSNAIEIDEDYKSIIYDWKADIDSIYLKVDRGKKYLCVNLKTSLPVTSDFFWQYGAYICLCNCDQGGIWKVQNLDSNGKVLYLGLDAFEDKGNNSDIDDYRFEWELRFIDKEHNMRITPISKNLNIPAYCMLSKPFIFHARAIVYNLSKIETVDQTFTSTATFELRLRGISDIGDPSAVDQLLKVVDIIKLITFPTLNEDIKDEEIWQKCNPSFTMPGTFDYTFSIKKQSQFAEKMELQLFPYDKQAMSMKMQIMNPCQGIRFYHNEEWPSVFTKNSFQMDDIYDITFDELVFHELTFSDPKESASGLSYPGIKFSIYLSRKPGYYFSNVMIPSSLFAILSLLSLGVLEDGTKIDTGGRLSITLTLLLTSVAYKFVVASSLPQLSYTTLLDWYVWGNLVFILIVAVENAIYPLLVSIYGQYISTSELYLLLALVALFVVGNFIFGFVIWRYLTDRKKKDMLTVKHEIDRRASHAKQINK